MHKNTAYSTLRNIEADSDKISTHLKVIDGLEDKVRQMAQQAEDYMHKADNCALHACSGF